MKKLMLTVVLGLAMSAPAATVTLTTTAYVNGAPTSQKGLTTPSQTKVPGGAPVFCAVVPPDGMTVEGWAVVNADGSLTALAGMAGKLSLVFTTTAAKKMTMLKVGFEKVRKAADVVEDLKFALDWENAELVIENGKPLVRYFVRNEDGEGEQRVRTLLDLDEITNENGREDFFELFDYTIAVWGQDEKGDWFLGYGG